MIEKYVLYSRILLASIWIQLTMGFVADEFLPVLEKAESAIYFMCDMVFLIMGVIMIRDRRDLWILISFFALAFSSTILINHEGIVTFANGSRSYFGILFAIPVLRYFITSENGNRFMRTFDRQLFYMLCLQVPCVLWQFIKYGAGDRVGGSLGDWNSGVISTLIYAISFYLASKRWNPDEYLQSLRENKVYVLLLLPSFFNETKASFIYLFFYFILLMRIDRTMIRRMLMASPAAIVLFCGVGYIYFTVTHQDSDEVLSVAFFEEYFLGEDADLDHVVELALAVYDDGLEVEGNYNNMFDVPRITKIILIPEFFRESHTSLWTGAGVGQFKGGSTLDETHFAKRYRWVLQGSRPWLFFVFVELGYLGLIWMVCTLLVDFLTKQNTAYSLNIKLYIAMMIALFFIYTDSMRMSYFCAIMFYIVLRTQYVLPEEKIKDKKDETRADEVIPSPSSAL